MNLKLIVALIPLLLAGQSVQAQPAQNEWDWKVAPYLWIVNGDGSSRIGSIKGDIDFDFSDVLDNLEMAGEIFVAADRGHHGFHLDATYLDLKPDPRPAPVGHGEVGTELEMTAVEVAYRHHFSGTPAGHALLLGGRYIDSTVTLMPTLVPGARQGVDWSDAFIGYQHVAPLSGRWQRQLQVTAGSGGANLAFTAQAMFARETQSGNHWVIGARIWDFDYDEIVRAVVPFELDLTLYGLTAGFLFD